MNIGAINLVHVSVPVSPPLACRFKDAIPTVHVEWPIHSCSEACPASYQMGTGRGKRVIFINDIHLVPKHKFTVLHL